MLRRVTDEGIFDEWMAQRYELLAPELYEEAVLAPAVGFLAELAGDRRALEFGVGTGRVAIPLRGRGVPVHGIELSAAMAARLRELDPDGGVGVTVGDLAQTRIDGTFAVVYLVRNTITNLTTQDEQVEAFRNAAAHLERGGCFVIENYIPELQRLPPGEKHHIFAATDDHVAYEEYDVATQIAISHHTWAVDGRLERRSSRHRYAWPSELDLMARIAGLRLRERWADWQRSPFTAESREHVSVWEKPAQADRRRPDDGVQCARGRLAQLVRALPLQGRCRGFESLIAHHEHLAPGAACYPSFAMAAERVSPGSEVIEAAREALASDARVAVAYLFGSFARGTADSKSDLDIAVLLTVPSERRLGGPLDELRDAVERACQRRCDLLDARSAPADLVHRILRDGVLLVDRDRSARIAFEVAKRNEYFDLLPYLREYRRGRSAR